MSGTATMSHLEKIQTLGVSFFGDRRCYQVFTHHHGAQFEISF
jgi:hypothetical protein